MGVGLVRSFQPQDLLLIHWRVYNSVANTSKGVLFVPPSDIYVRSFLYLLSLQFSSVAQSCLTLCDPMNLSIPGLPIHHQLPEFTQTHVHQVGDAIQPSHPLSSASPPALNPSQHQGLSQWVNYFLYTLIKLYYTKSLSDQASSLAPDWTLLLRNPRVPVVLHDSATTFHFNP